MINVLYVHGLNSSGNSSTAKLLGQYLDNSKYKVFSFTYDYNKPDMAFSQLKTHIRANHIDIVIGSSLGGFMTLKLRNVMKIAINPCCDPVKELPKLGVSQSVTDNYERISSSLWNNVDAEEREITFGIFGTHDELFSYKKEFSSHYNNVYSMNDGHRISPINIKNVLVPLVYKIVNVIRPELAKKLVGVVINESIPNVEYITVYSQVNERFVNAHDPKEMEKYADEVWDILQKSYAYCGGLLGMNSVKQLIDESDMWKMVRRNGKINCVVVYSYKRGGRKMCYGGTDGTPDGKVDFFKIMQEDINLKDRKAWAEVSEKMEHLYLKNGAVPIPANIAKIIMADKEFISYEPDGYHYTRYIGGIAATKMMVGNFTGTSI